MTNRYGRYPDWHSDGRGTYWRTTSLGRTEVTRWLTSRHRSPEARMWRLVHIPADGSGPVARYFRYHRDAMEAGYAY